jgi:hypothetical protein
VSSLHQEEAFTAILDELRKASGVDFRQYKPNTSHRRALRRAVILKLDTLGEYAQYLKEHPEEGLKIYDDVLIPVTSFFRDFEAFEALKWKASRPGTTLILDNAKDMPEGHFLRKLKNACPQCWPELWRVRGMQRKVPECEQWSLHKFRATFITQVLRHSDLKTAIEMVGHSQAETTMLYKAAATSEEQQRIANSVNWEQ